MTLRGTLLILLTACLGAADGTAGPSAETLVDLDPATTAWTTLPGEANTGGAVPVGWTDNSAWRRSRVDHRRGEQDGIAYWRIDISRPGGSSVFIPIDGTDREAVYRLTARVRGLGIDKISFGLQQLDAPWAAPWNQVPTMEGGWQDLDWSWRHQPASTRHGLYLQIDARAGSLDLARVRLERWTVADYLALNAAPQGGPKNLLRLTRAPAGLPPGWALDREDSDDEVEVAADPAVSGPGGGPALRLRTPKPLSHLWCGAVLVPAGASHVASLWVRGQGSGALLIPGKPWQFLARKPFSVTTAEGWKRVQVAFEPLLPTQVQALKLAFTGELWIDALQLERGAEASAYAAPFPCEIGLRHSSPARLQFTPAVALDWAIVGPCAGARVAFEVSDAYGRSLALPPQPAAATGSVHGDGLADRPFGALRIQATVVAADGGALSPPCELVVLRLPPPRHAGEDAPDSFFGVHSMPVRRHLVMAKAIGANWVRLHDAAALTTWHQLEPEAGKWAFRDADLQRYRSHHLKILGMLSTAPRWASTVGDDHEGYFDQYYQPKDLAAWQNYVRTVTTRYRDVIDAWEVWNEPWGDLFWHLSRDQQRKAWVVGPTPAEDFARLAAATRAVDPTLRILGISTATEDHSHDWTEKMRAAGALATCDVISYHQYVNPAATADDQVAQGRRSALGPLLGPDGRPAKPVWMTEGNPLVNCDGPGLYRCNQPGAGTEAVAVAGDRLARWLVSLRARGDAKGFLYSMHCHGYFHEAAPYRSVVGRDGYLHPVAAAYAACAWHLEDSVPAGISEVVPGVWAFAFAAAQRAVVALAPQPGHAALTVPAGVAAADLFGNPLVPGTPIDATMVYLSGPGSAADLLAAIARPGNGGPAR